MLRVSELRGQIASACDADQAAADTQFRELSRGMWTLADMVAMHRLLLHRGDPDHAPLPHMEEPPAGATAEGK